MAKVISVLFISVALLAVNRLQGEERNLSELLDSISAKVGDLTAPTDLWRIDEFVSLYRSPAQFHTEARRLLAKKSLNAQQRSILCLALKNLSPRDYSLLVMDELERFSEGSILLILTDRSDGKNPIQDASDTPDVLAFLQSVKKKFSSSEAVSAVVNEILRKHEDSRQ